MKTAVASIRALLAASCLPLAWAAPLMAEPVSMAETVPPASPQDSVVDPKLIAEAYDYAYPAFALSQYRWNSLNERGGRPARPSINSLISGR